MEQRSGPASLPCLAELANEGRSSADLRRIAKERTARRCAGRDKAAIADLRTRLNREKRELHERGAVTEALTSLSVLLDRHAIVLGSPDAMRERN